MDFLVPGLFQEEETVNKQSSSSTGVPYWLNEEHCVSFTKSAT
jgi:hypothetical protein